MLPTRWTVCRANVRKTSIGLRNSNIPRVQVRSCNNNTNIALEARARQLADVISKRLNIRSLDDWYRLQYKDLRSVVKAVDVGRNFGMVLETTNYSPTRFVQLAFPEHQWMPWLFQACPRNFWASVENQRQYLEWLEKELRIQKLEDWYTVTSETFKKHHGSSLLGIYNNSPREILIALKPDHTWHTWLFSKVPKNWWKSVENQREYLTWLGERLGYKTMEDWYKITNTDLSSNYGSKLLKIYNTSAQKAVMTVFSDHKWYPWLFKQSPKNLWAGSTSIKDYIEWVGPQLGIKTLNDWYNVTPSAILQLNKGQTFYRSIQKSLPDILQAAYPNHTFHPWMFKVTPEAWWRDVTNQRKFLEYAAGRLGVHTLEDWYKVSVHDLEAIGGATLAWVHGHSMLKILETAFPYHSWDSFKFSKTSPKFWESISPEKIVRLVEHLGKQVGVDPTRVEDWYDVDVKKLGSRAIKALQKVGGLKNALRIAYPNYSWDDLNPRAPALSKATQKKMIKVLQQELPQNVTALAKRGTKKQK